MADVNLRTYRPGDWQAMYRLDLACFEEAFRFSRRAMRAFAETPDTITILAEAEGELAGFCITHMQEQVGYVVTLDVAPAWRRAGLARRLMAEIEARVHTAGGTGTVLHVYTGNTGAVRFYEAIGYERIATSQNFYSKGMNAFLYRKR